MLQLPKQFHPDFINKSVKPRYPIEVDWSNNYAKNLSALCDFTTIDSVAREQISGINGTLHASAPGWGVNPRGRMWESSGSGNFTPWGISFDSTKTNEFLGASGEDGFNVVIVGRFNSIGGSANLANLVGDDGDDGLSINSDGTVSWVSGFARLTTTNSISSGEYFTIIAGYKYNDASTYINLNGVTTTGSPGGFSITGRLEYICGRSGQNVCRAELNVFYIIDGILTEKQVDALSKDPYQIFKPVSPVTLFTAVAGGGFTLPIDSGSFALSGAGVALRASYKIQTLSGSYTFTGTATGLSVGRSILAGTGSYTLTGTQSALLAARKAILDSGTFNLTGTDVTLTYTVDKTIIIDSGVITLTGASAGLVVARKVTIDSGVYATTGTDVNLRLGRNIAAQSGSYAYTGAALGLLVGRNLTANSGTFTLTGSNVNLQQAKKILASGGSYTLTGTDVNLTYSPVTGETIVVESGTISLLGAANGLIVKRNIVTESGTYNLTGNTVNLTVSRSLSLASGSYTETGYDISFLRSYVLSASSNAFSLTGTSITLTYSNVPVIPTPLTRTLSIPFESRSLNISFQGRRLNINQ